MSAITKIRTRVLPGHRIDVAAPALVEGDLVDVTIESSQASDRESRFHELSTRWQHETAVLSSISQIALHPAYQEVIGMGQAAVPLILNELATKPNHWFWALRAITGEDPIKPAHRGKVKDMAADWLQWAKENGYVTQELSLATTNS